MAALYKQDRTRFATDLFPFLLGRKTRMADDDKPESCEYCMTDIDREENPVEAAGHVFCDDDCYNTWREEERDA